MKLKFLQTIVDIIRKKRMLVSVLYQSEKPLIKPFTLPESTFKHILTTRGFGCSGSGVLIDLLSECDNTTVIGGYDVRGGSPLAFNKKIPKIEIDLLRKWGGLFWLENYYKNPFGNNHIAIANFINLYEDLFSHVDYTIYNNKFLELSREFIDKIADKIEIENPLAGYNYIQSCYRNLKEYGNLESPFVINEKRKPHTLYQAKKITHEEFIQYAKEYLNNFLKTIDKKYIDDYRMIAVYRDPRDVFVEGSITGEVWIPHEAENFVKWYKTKNIKKYIESNHPNVMTIRFEDLVLDYDNTIPKVLEFYGIDKSHHVAPKTQFRPEYSRKNIELYKNFEDQESIKYIEDALKEYCYYRKD